MSATCTYLRPVANAASGTSQSYYLTLLNLTFYAYAGISMPVVGLGVYQNPNCKPACLAALQSGYRSVASSPPPQPYISEHDCRHIDSARAYKNEAQVGEAVRDSGLPRQDIFVSMCTRHLSYRSRRMNVAAGF